MPQSMGSQRVRHDLWLNNDNMCWTGGLEMSYKTRFRWWRMCLTFLRLVNLVWLTFCFCFVVIYEIKESTLPRDKPEFSHNFWKLDFMVKVQQQELQSRIWGKGRVEGLIEKEWVDLIIHSFLLYLQFSFKHNILPFLDQKACELWILVVMAMTVSVGSA